MYTDADCTNKSSTLTLKTGDTYSAKDMGWANGSHIYYLKSKYIKFGSIYWSVQ